MAENTQTEKYSKVLDLDGSQVPVVEGSGGFNASLYVGKKVRIARYEIREEIDFYPNGKDYSADSKEKCFKVYIFTEKLKELVLKDPANPTEADSWLFGDKLVEFSKDDGVIKNIEVHARFNLQKSAEGKPEISKKPLAKCWQFMRKIGANNLNELKGKLVMLDVETNKNDPTDDRKFLRIVT